MCCCHLGRNRNCSSREIQGVLGGNGHNGREKETKTGRASLAKPSGEEKYRAPLKEKKGTEERGRRKGPPK